MFISWLIKSFHRQVARQLPIAPSRARRRQQRRQAGFDLLEAREVPAFLAPASFPTGTNPTGVAVGEYNGDGKQDMAVVNSSDSSTVGILISKGDGAIQPSVDDVSVGFALETTAGDFEGGG